MANGKIVKLVKQVKVVQSSQYKVLKLAVFNFQRLSV